MAVVFHLAIQLTARVEVFSYLAVAALVIWAVPSTRDRVLVVDPARGGHRRLAAGVRALDWLARFRIEHGSPGAVVTVVDRGGRVLTGRPRRGVGRQPVAGDGLAGAPRHRTVVRAPPCAAPD